MPERLKQELNLSTPRNTSAKPVAFGGSFLGHAQGSPSGVRVISQIDVVRIHGLKPSSNDSISPEPGVFMAFSVRAVAHAGLGRLHVLP